jgi:hypothetical protein
VPVRMLWESEARRVEPSARQWRRDRVDRALCTEPLFRRRVRALLVVGVVAFGAVGTGTSVATESDRRGEGLSGPGAEAPALIPEPPALPAEPVDTPPDVGMTSPPSAPAEDHALEPEPVDDPYGRLVLGTPDAPAVPTDDPADPAEPPLGDPPGVLDEEIPPVVPAPTDTPPAEPVPPAPGTEPNLDVAPRLVHDGRELPRPQLHVRGRRESGTRRTAMANPPADAQSPVLVAEPTTVAQPAASAHSLATPAPSPPRGVPRFHVVRPGESLWSIAQTLLPPRAATPAIAAEVARLWLLNSRRIGTGNPNLLPVGVALRLRQ